MVEKTTPLHIVNCMFSRGLGGIEQSFVDYCVALKLQENNVTAIISPDAAIIPQLSKLGITQVKIGNVGQWDPLAVLRLRWYFKKADPDAIITHGNRATVLVKKAAKHIAPVIGVTHNYSVKHFIGLDAVFTVTETLKAYVDRLGQEKSTLYHIPNMIDLAEDVHIIAQPYFSPPVIGTLGRFVKKKGFDVFIKALAILRDKDVAFHAIIGGDGEVKQELITLIDRLGLSQNITLPGWIDHKKSFFDAINIFCLPSLHEPFGIVLLEAFKYGIPIVSTSTEGPSEIIEDKYNGLLVSPKSPEELAHALQLLLQDQQKAFELASNGIRSVKEYSIPIISERIQSALTEVINNYV